MQSTERNRFKFKLTLFIKFYGVGDVDIHWYGDVYVDVDGYDDGEVDGEVVCEINDDVDVDGDGDVDVDVDSHGEVYADGDDVKSSEVLRRKLIILLYFGVKP